VSSGEATKSTLQFYDDMKNEKKYKGEIISKKIAKNNEK